ncbi:MAG: hypothetical protein U0Q18_06415 [Bryobacteraceae bacterium]
MKLLIPVGMCCLLTTAALAQRHGGGGGHVGGAVGSSHGAPGGGHRGGGVFNGGHRGGVAAYGHGFDRFRSLYSPWGYGAYWPVYWGGSGWWGASDYYDGTYSPYNNYNSTPNVTVIAPPPQPPYPVVISQAIQPAQPVIHEYRTQEDYGLPAEKQAGPVLYLIAFRDHVIRASFAYWVQNATLHYLDTDHKERQAALSSVDAEFSAQLNRERHIPFSLENR